MVAIRETLQVKNHRISYTLPKSFNYDEIEMIILPKIDDKEKKTDEELEAFSSHSASTVKEWLDDSEDDIWK